MTTPPPRPPLLGRLILRLCRLGERRDDVRADMRELFATRVTSQGVREARRRFTHDALSLLLPSRRSVTSGFGADLRDAVRALRRTPLQTASLFLCLLLGTTLTVVMFTVVNTLFAGDLPGIRDRSTLVRLTALGMKPNGERSGDRRSIAVRHYLDLPPTLPGVTAIAFQIGSTATSAAVNGVPTRVRAELVNGDFFITLGTRPTIGRLLQSSDDHTSSPPTMVLGYDLWQRSFGGSSDAIGQTIGLGTSQYQIVGVAPKGFGGISEVQSYSLGGGASDGADLWVPKAHAAWAKDAVVLSCGGCAGGKVVFRLAAGSSSRDVEQHLSQHPVGYALEPFRLTQAGTDAAELVGGVALLMTVPFLVLAIACTNVAGVQLSRALRRTPELATRVALGATRLQLTRLISLETAVLAVAAGLGAWFITWQALRWTEGLLPVAITADWRVFVFALLTPLAVTLVSGLLPSWRATGFRVLDGLQQGAGAGATVRVTRLRRLVLTVQIALSVALLGTSLHLARGVAAAPAALAPPQADVLTASLRLYELGFTVEQRTAIRMDLDRTFRTLPGVELVGFGEPLFTQVNSGGGAIAHTRLVTGDWFGAIGHRVLAGRLPTEAESDVIVINETMAEQHGGAHAAVGRTLNALSLSSGDESSTPRPATVLAVVDDGYERVAWGHRVAVAYMVAPTGKSTDGLSTFFLKGPGAAVAEKQVREMLARIHPQLAPYDIGTIAVLVERKFAAARLAVNALASMSVAALLLAAVGLFGAISQSAAARMREFGVRLALGARPIDIGHIVLRETAWVSGVGLSIGLLVSTLAAASIRGSMLQTASPGDVVPAAVVVVAVGVIAFLAALTPARRVMAIDPVRSLRAE
jgi:predicted permease